MNPGVFDKGIRREELDAKEIFKPTDENRAKILQIQELENKSSR